MVRGARGGRVRARGRELDERRGKHLVTLYLPTVCCGVESLLALQPPCVGLAPLCLVSVRSARPSVIMRA